MMRSRGDLEVNVHLNAAIHRSGRRLHPSLRRRREAAETLDIKHESLRGENKIDQGGHAGHPCRVSQEEEQTPNGRSRWSSPLSPNLVLSTESEPRGLGAGVDGGCSFLPFLDVTAPLMHSITANRLSRFPSPFNCKRDGGVGSGACSAFGSSGLICSAKPSSSSSSSHGSPGACTSVGTPVLFPFAYPFSSDNHRQDLSSASSAVRSLSTSVRVYGLGLGSRGGGPAFVGQVFSTCDPSGTGLVAVTNHFDISFLTKRHPDSQLCTGSVHHLSASQAQNNWSLCNCFHFPVSSWFSNPWWRPPGI